MGLQAWLQRGIRPSTSTSSAALWLKSGLNAALFFAVFMVVLPALAHRLAHVALPLDGFWVRDGLAGGLALMGLGWWIAALDAFSRLGRGTPLPLDAPQRLVTRGPFRLVRNPIMLGEVLVIWAEALHFACLGIAVYAALVTICAHLLVVRVEEPELGARFGDAYAEYRQRVPRWIPHWPRRRRSLLRERGGGGRAES